MNIIMTLLHVLLFGILFNITQQEKLVPDMSNRTVILSLAELSANAYHSANSNSWRNSTGEWIYVNSFGWTDEETVKHLYGHVFLHVEKPLVTIAFRGTSRGSKFDAEEDNCIFGCCCSNNNCDNGNCDIDKFKQSYIPSSYYTMSLQLYSTVKELFPHHQIWFTGHSLGAMLAVTSALTLCEPAVGFAAPGDRLFATRLELDEKCQHLVHHIGYYHDPIFTGTCGWLCRLAGYHIDAKCHLGTICVYNDTAPVSELNIVFDAMYNGPFWIRYHTINWLIDNVLKIQGNVPKCISEVNCTETCTD